MLVSSSVYRGTGIGYCAWGCWDAGLTGAGYAWFRTEGMHNFCMNVCMFACWFVCLLACLLVCLYACE